ncbi:MAG: HAMP domain-containing histidine kinase [Gemmatimonadetes bacterium]|nr:HAMP domain-containing histidine kinase [Gemmatimonadota bacterium]
MISDQVRRALPIALLLAALAVAGVGAFQAQKAQRTHRATAESLLRDYGAFAAWSFNDRAAAAIESGVKATVPTRTALLDASRPEACLEDILAESRRRTTCGCSEPLGGDFAFLVRLAGDGVPSEFVGEPPEQADRSAVLKAAAAAARSSEGVRRGFGVTELVGSAGETTLLAWTRVTSATDTVVYGVELAPARIESALASVFADQQLLPEALTEGASNAGMLAVSLSTTSGRVLYASGPEVEGALGARESWPAVLGGGVVTAAVLPEVADRLIIGGLPRSQVPWLLVIFGLSAGLALVAVTYLRRDALLARQRGDFVASVSHELRTPLAQIRLFVETLRLGRTENDEQRAWALGTIDRETLRLTRLVENVLHFSRSERGGRRLEPEPLVLATEAAGVVEEFRPLLRPRQATIRVDVADHLQVEADRDALRQVLLNLLDNAAKYGPAGQTITVRAVPGGPVVRLHVEDEGPGVPPAEREVIWQSFRRGERAVGTVVVGSGIGLSVVRALVTALGGRCWVEDGDGGGARFVVELPALVTAAPRRLADGPAADTPVQERTAGAAGAA